MNIYEFKQKLDSIIERYPEDRLKDVQVCVPIETVGAVASKHVTHIKSIQMGSDWDHNRLLLYTYEKLMLENPDTLDKLRKEMSDMGWTQYHNNNLKRENKKLLKRIEELEKNNA